MPAARSALAAAGAMTSISSRPRWPPSPACGFRPQTRMRGARDAELRRRSCVEDARAPCRAARRVMRGADLRAAAGAWWRAPRAGRRRPASSPACAAPVRSARYSVWPVNGTPASLMTLFCTGAVTMAANSPRSAAVERAVEQREHVARVGGIEPARRRRARRAARAAGCGARGYAESGAADSRAPSSRARRRAASDRCRDTSWQGQSSGDGEPGPDRCRPVHPR